MLTTDFNASFVDVRLLTMANGNQSYLFRVIGNPRREKFQIVVFVVVSEFGFPLSPFLFRRPFPPLTRLSLFLQLIKFSAGLQLALAFLYNQGREYKKGEEGKGKR